MLGGRICVSSRQVSILCSGGKRGTTRPQGLLRWRLTFRLCRSQCVRVDLRRPAIPHHVRDRPPGVPSRAMLARRNHEVSHPLRFCLFVDGIFVGRACKITERGFVSGPPYGDQPSFAACDSGPPAALRAHGVQPNVHWTFGCQTHEASHPRNPTKQKKTHKGSLFVWRRERDSNPRYGIRRTHAFQACTLSHSVISPETVCACLSCLLELFKDLRILKCGDVLRNLFVFRDGA